MYVYASLVIGYWYLQQQCKPYHIKCIESDCHSSTCDWIWEIHLPRTQQQVLRQTIAVQQFGQALVLKVTQTAFTMACFWGLSDIHGCSGGLYMASSPLDKHTASCNSPHHWLMSLAMDLAALCDLWRWIWHWWTPFGYLQYWYNLWLSLYGYPPTLPPHRSASGIGYTSKKYLERQAFS